MEDIYINVHNVYIYLQLMIKMLFIKIKTNFNS